MFASSKLARALPWSWMAAEPDGSWRRITRVSWELANLILTAALAGLIWTVQLVLYPLFALVGASEWHRYGAEHRRRITWLAAPLMLSSVGVAIALTLEEASGLSVLNAALGVGVLVLTGLVFAPLHGRLERGASKRTVGLLVRVNWLRTMAWTAQLMCAAALM